MPCFSTASYRRPICRHTEKRKTYLAFAVLMLAQRLWFALIGSGAGSDLLGRSRTRRPVRARVTAGRSRFSPKKSRIGEAIKIDEEVPMMMPNMIAKPKPRITSPPISSSGRIERTTDSDVATVRPSV